LEVRVLPGPPIKAAFPVAALIFGAPLGAPLTSRVFLLSRRSHIESNLVTRVGGAGRRRWDLIRNRRRGERGHKSERSAFNRYLLRHRHVVPLKPTVGGRLPTRNAPPRSSGTYSSLSPNRTSQDARGMLDPAMCSKRGSAALRIFGKMRLAGRTFARSISV
jgi:hypothetical protein